MTRRRNILLSVLTRIVLCAFILAVAAAVFILLVRTRPQPARSDRGDQPPRVLVMEAESVPVRRQWDGYGTARAMRPVNVPSRVTSTVEELPVSVQAGAEVERGDVLARLDASDFLRQAEMAEQAIEEVRQDQANLVIEKASWQERLELAKEQVELSRAEYERAVEAFERGSANQREVDVARQALVNALGDLTVTQTEFDRIAPREAALEARLGAQQAQLRLARQDVERSTITSPITGFIQSVDVEEGESVMAGSRIARIVDLSRIEVPLRLPSSARDSVRVGDDVLLSSAGGRPENWPAHISRILPEEDEATRTMAAYVEIEQDPRQGGLLAPGRFVRGIVVSSQPEWRWVVPRRAVREDTILLVEKGRIERHLIDIAYQLESELPQLGLPDEQWVVLEDVLPDGALVVINASRELPDGTIVEPVRAGDGAVTARPPGEATP